MDYRLRRQPDGTVNAQPGDAVEYWMYGRWNANRIEGQAYGEFVILGMSDEEPRIHAHISNVRHARGGAGWHRLREARLREALERVLNDTDMLHEEYHWQWLAEALADLDTEDADNVEPEA